MIEPARRGRKPRLAPIAQTAEATRAVEPREEVIEAVAPSKRRRRASVGGFSLKLAADAREGFVRRWGNDDGARLSVLQEDLAYDFVLDDKGQKIARHVGKKPSGEPMLAYLMETPDAEYAVGQREKEERVRLFEQAITSGRDTTGELKASETYVPVGASSSVKRGR